jgi:ariadne-1
MKDTEKDKDKKFECSICLANYYIYSKEIVTVSKCGHQFCSRCLESYLWNELYPKSKYSCLEFDCPHKGCNAEIQDFEILRMLRREGDKDKYYQFTIDHFLYDQRDCKSCPACGVQVILEESYYSSTIKCPGCKRLYCGNCENFWHNGRECYEYDPNEGDNEDDELNVIWKSKHSKPCPSCRVDIEKFEGCNHMTCTQCEHTFCFLCLEEWDSDHYQVGECAGRQFEVTTVESDNEEEQKNQNHYDYY